MKALKYGFGLILVGGFALTASCGGSSSGDSSAAAGSSSSNAGSSSDTGGSDTVTGGGTTGTTSGGTTGTTSGGAGTTTGGTTGTTTGGAGTTTGGMGATTGGAGAMNPAGCPAASTMPKTGDACTATAGGRATTCTYAADPGEDMACGCAPARVGGRGPGGGAAGAPDVMDTLTCVTTCAAHTSTPPMSGEACTLNAFTACTFGPDARTNTDRCRCTANKWVCTAIGGMGAAGAGP